MKSTTPTPADPDRLILCLRGHRVILAHDLSALYGVPTKALNQAVARNPERFPEDFMFALTGAETDMLIRTASATRRLALVHSTRIRAFTEHGVAMLSSVLQSRRAVQVNIHIIRTFVRMRQASLDHDDLRRRLESLESKTDRRFREVFTAIKVLIDESTDPRPRIGFQPE